MSDIKKYMISMLNPDSDMYTLHRPVSAPGLVQGTDFVMNKPIEYHRHGRVYRGDKSLIGRLKMGLMIDESYEIDNNLPEKQKRHINEMIDDILKKEKEKEQWP